MQRARAGQSLWHHPQDARGPALPPAYAASRGTARRLQIAQQLVAAMRRGLTLKEVARQIGVSLSTAYRAKRALCQREDDAGGEAAADG